MTIYRHANSGLLPGAKIGGKWFFSKQTIQDLIINRQKSNEGRKAAIMETPFRSHYLVCPKKNDQKIHFEVCLQTCAYFNLTQNKDQYVCTWALFQAKTGKRYQSYIKNLLKRQGIAEDLITDLMISKKVEQLQLSRLLRSIERRKNHGTDGTGNRGTQKINKIDG